MNFETTRASRAIVRLLASRLRIAGKNEDAIKAADACDLLVDELEQQMLANHGPMRMAQGQDAELERLHTQQTIAVEALLAIAQSDPEQSVPAATQASSALIQLETVPMRPNPIQDYVRMQRGQVRTRSVLLARA